jgi:L-amino acid N-acyltransferase YncA
VTDLLERLVEARVGWTSSAIRSWYAEESLRLNLRRALSVEADRLGDAAFGREFRDGVGIDGPEDPLTWANRMVDLPDGGWALTGIRFRGRDTRRPFVDVVATSAPPDPDGLALVAAVVVPAFREFGPLCLRVDAPEPDALVGRLRDDLRFGHGCAVDMHVVAGLVATLAEAPRTPAYPQVGLRAGDPQELAPRVGEIYRELARQVPGLATWAQPEDLESLTECAEEGLLFEVLVEGASGGVVAALRLDDHGMTGFSVQEICLDAAHRGRRLAPASLQRLVGELPAGPEDVLWGTIDPGNAPSLRNAISIGRTVVGGYVWVAPAGLPGMPASAAG